MKSGVLAIPFEWDFEPEFFDTEGKKVNYSRSWLKGKSFGYALEPGRYTVKFKKLSGYEQISEKVVDVVEGEVFELNVQLKSEVK